MDTSDPFIHFDKDGICQYCKEFVTRLENETFHGGSSEPLDRMLCLIQDAGKGKPYDCIIGLSGGVDSSFVAREVVRLGLRPLAVHLDNGWNSELAVDNIHRILDRLKIDFQTHVVDWDEFRDLQLSFIRASVPNIEIATDHAINALLANVARKNHVKYIITGGNIRGEGIYPKSWGWYNLDLKHLKAVHKQFGTGTLKTYPTISLTDFLANRFLFGIRYFSVLNYIDYNKIEAQRVLMDELGWRPYGGKHFESIWTRFYQGYIMPKKFGVDKRLVHLSTLVVAGDISREEALAELERDPYADGDLEGDKDYVLRKLRLSAAEFENIMSTPPRPHTDYPTNAWFFEGAPQLKSVAKRLLRGY